MSAIDKVIKWISDWHPELTDDFPETIPSLGEIIEAADVAAYAADRLAQADWIRKYVKCPKEL